MQQNYADYATDEQIASQEGAERTMILAGGKRQWEDGKGVVVSLLLCLLRSGSASRIFDRRGGQEGGGGAGIQGMHSRRLTCE